MTYAADAPPAVSNAPHRPLAVRLAAVLLLVMAVAGLAYAAATIAITPGVLDRFREAAAAADGGEVDSYATVVWLVATVGAVLAVVLFALYVVLALGLRRGSHGARVGTWVVSGLGLLFGCGSAATVAAERAGDATPGTLSFALTSAYPGSWIELNLAVAGAQMLGYVVVGVLIAVTPGEFFRRNRPESARSPAYVALPTYGSQVIPPGYPAAYPGVAVPASAAPMVSPEEQAAWARPAPTAEPPPPTSAASDGPGNSQESSSNDHSPHSPS